MCGRFYTEVDREEMQNILDAVRSVLSGNELVSQMKTGEIFPTDITPVYVNSRNGAVPALMKWGFPGFPKSGSGATPPVIINARSETIHEKPTFSKYLHQRCLVPATSYFEWAKDDIKSKTKKTKYAFHPSDDRLSLFWMAAIFRDSTNSRIPVFTILTMDASPSISMIHNRMPVIFRCKESRRDWMNGEQDLSGLFQQGTIQDIKYSQVV